LAKIVAKNVASRPKEFHSEVRMWVREKIVSHHRALHAFSRERERFLWFGELMDVFFVPFW
jgi:hypothetical protein